jgi:hypothetical protein
VVAEVVAVDVLDVSDVAGVVVLDDVVSVGVGDGGVEAQPGAVSATDGSAAKVLNRNSAPPINASPIAALSAAGFRSRALTVHPRFN